jgi:hypothetical protein
MSERRLMPTKDFAEIARGFCSWCEDPLHDNQEVTAAVWLSKLNAAALLLPEVGCVNEDELPEISESVFAAVRDNLGRFNGWYYREYFDPDPSLDDESCMGDVGDDLLDTYRDVKRGQLLFERGSVAEALGHWSFLHRIHWGRHAVGAMFAIHCLFVSKRGYE